MLWKEENLGGIGGIILNPDLIIQLKFFLMNYLTTGPIKKVEMKNLLISIILLALLNSCGTDQGSKTYKLTAKNSSGKDIMISAFVTSNNLDNPSQVTNLNIEEEITKFYESNPPLLEIYTFSNFFGGDSIVVNFNNERTLSYIVETKCGQNFRNPLNNCEYNKQEETFTFTEEDYRNATPCDGDCE